MRSFSFFGGGGSSDIHFCVFDWSPVLSSRRFIYTHTHSIEAGLTTQRISVFRVREGELLHKVSGGII